MNAGQSLKACGLLIDPARLPLASSSLRSAAPAFLLFDRPGNSVPPKEPPSLRCEMPPPKHLATVVSEPDPDCFTLLLFVVRSLSNDCASAVIQICHKRTSLVFPIKLDPGVRGLAVAG